jgi:hypothetical protein
MPKPDPIRRLIYRARHICEVEIANLMPLGDDVEALRTCRQQLMDQLRADAAEALRRAVQGGVRLEEAEQRIGTLIAACQGLQARPLEWRPEPLQAYAFSGEGPFDLVKAGDEEADRWRRRQCEQRANVVEDACVKLHNLWLTLGGPVPSPKANRRLRKRDTRAAKIERLTDEMRQHMCAARDYAFFTQGQKGTPELLPRPLKKDLSRRAE